MLATYCIAVGKISDKDYLENSTRGMRICLWVF